MDREAWRAGIHGVAKSRTWLSIWTKVWLMSKTQRICTRAESTLGDRHKIERNSFIAFPSQRGKLGLLLLRVCVPTGKDLAVFMAMVQGCDKHCWEFCKTNKKSTASWGQKIKAEMYNRLPKAWEESQGEILWEIKTIQKCLCILEDSESNIHARFRKDLRRP